MANFQVKFNIDQITNDSPLGAVQKVQDFIAGREGMTFTCRNEKTGKCYSVDLGELKENGEVDEKNAVLPMTQVQYEEDNACDGAAKKEKVNQKLVDAVIEDMKKNFAVGDYTVLDELLKFIPKVNLLQALPEEDWSKFPKVKKQIS